MEPLSRTWLILASLPRPCLDFARSCMTMAYIPRSSQNLGKASKELAMDLGKDTVASNTDNALTFRKVSLKATFSILAA